jgi:hypothetical protein
MGAPSSQQAARRGSTGAPRSERSSFSYASGATGDYRCHHFCLACLPQRAACHGACCCLHVGLLACSTAASLLLRPLAQPTTPAPVTIHRHGWKVSAPLPTTCGFRTYSGIILFHPGVLTGVVMMLIATIDGFESMAIQIHAIFRP